MGRSLHLANRLAWIFALVGCIDESSLSPPPAPACNGGACEGGVVEGGVDAAAPAPKVCAPGDVSTFESTWKPPTGRWQGKCTVQQVDTYVACLFSQAANDPTCRDYLARADNAVCSHCLMSAVDDTSYGPLIRFGPNAITVNVEGCVALVTSDAQATGCGAKAQALGQCRRAACAPNCPLTDQASLVAFNECEVASNKSVCKSYLSASACLAPLLEGRAAACASGPTPLAVATGVAKFFCGPP